MRTILKRTKGTTQQIKSYKTNAGVFSIYVNNNRILAECAYEIFQLIESEYFVKRIKKKRKKESVIISSVTVLHLLHFCDCFIGTNEPDFETEVQCYPA